MKFRGRREFEHFDDAAGFDHDHPVEEVLEHPPWMPDPALFPGIRPPGSRSRPLRRESCRGAAGSSSLPAPVRPGGKLSLSPISPGPKSWFNNRVPSTSNRWPHTRGPVHHRVSPPWNFMLCEHARVLDICCFNDGRAKHFYSHFRPLVQDLRGQNSHCSPPGASSNLPFAFAQEVTASSRCRFRVGAARYGTNCINVRLSLLAGGQMQRPVTSAGYVHLRDHLP